MTRSRSRLRQIGAALAVLLLLGFLYVNLRGVDPIRHDYVSEKINELQGLDAELNEAVLKLRYGLLHNYDSLVSTLNRTREIHSSLASGPNAIAGRGDREIDATMANVSAAQLEREALLERFKSENALLRNSVYYLPLLTGQIVKDPAASPALREMLQTVLREALSLQVSTTRNDYAETAAAIAAVGPEVDRAPLRLRDPIDKARRHAQLIMNAQQQMDSLIPRLTSSESSVLGNRLASAYNHSFERQLLRGNAYRLALFFVSAGLLLYGAYAFARWREDARKLTESETRYRSVVAAILEGVVVRDATGHILQANASAERILGRTFAQLKGQWLFDPDRQAIQEDGSPFSDYERPVNVALRTGQPQEDVTMGFRRADGDVLWLSMSTQPLFQAGSTQPSGVVSSFADITQRKQLQARRTMEHAITRVLAATESVPEAMTDVIRTLCETLGFVYGSYWQRDAHGTIVREVASWCIDADEIRAFAAASRERPRTLRPGGLMRQVWRSPEPVWIADVTQEPTYNRAPLATRAGLRGAFALPIVFEGETFGAIECYRRDTRPPDEIFLDSATAISSQMGQFIQRKRAEEQLHLAANAMKNSAEGIAMYDADRRIVFINESFTTITGYSADEVLGKHSDFLRSGQDEAAFYEQLWETVSQKGRWQGEVWRRRKNGEIYPELRSVSAITDKTGKTTNYVVVFTDIAQFKEYEERLKFMAHHDPLTHLPNRVLFQDRCNEALLRAQRHGTLAAILFVDLDRFKTINDSLGHPTGDALLQAAAGRLGECVRASDTVARSGGDEFTILLDELRDAEDAAVVAQKILEALQRPFVLSGHELVISASIGISSFPVDGTNTEALLKNADAAMYRAKEQGRNAYRFFSGEMNAHALETLLLTNSLRFALERDELLLNYQPRVELAGKRIVCVEALIRWKRADGELVSPSRFIPLAEDTGLIVPIGEWVIRTACKQLRAWHDAGYTHLQMAVNLSARQLSEDNIAQRIGSIVAEAGLDARCLEIEITESMIMQDVEGAVKVLRALHAIGLPLAIDDFGTGYSSLSYLKRFPIYSLKIDQSFVRGIPADQDDVAITRTIVAMAKGLKLHVIAEGVETAAQADFLTSLDCDEAQGFFFSKPVPVPELEALLRASGLLAPKTQLQLAPRRAQRP